MVSSDKLPLIAINLSLISIGLVCKQSGSSQNFVLWNMVLKDIRTTQGEKKAQIETKNTQQSCWKKLSRKGISRTTKLGSSKPKLI